MARRTSAETNGHTDLGAKIHEVVNDACEFAGCDVEKLENKVESYVREKPQKSLLIAFAVGFAASIFLRRK